MVRNYTKKREWFESLIWGASLFFLFKNKNPRFWARRVRNLKSASFHSSITQEIMVATQKKVSQGLEDAWNNLYAGFFKGVASTLVFASLLEDEQRLSVGVLLTVLKSEIKPSTPASFHNFRTSKVVIGLIANHFHKFGDSWFAGTHTRNKEKTSTRRNGNTQKTSSCVTLTKRAHKTD